jgi:hypothetical protein
VKDHLILEEKGAIVTNLVCYRYGVEAAASSHHRASTRQEKMKIVKIGDMACACMSRPQVHKKIMCAKEVLLNNYLVPKLLTHDTLLSQYV